MFTYLKKIIFVDFGPFSQLVQLSREFALLTKES